MDPTTTEQALRREAIRRRLQGERRIDICHALQRSRRWFSKWWAEYQRNPQSDFAAHARAPRTSPQQLPRYVSHAVVAVRQVLEAAATPETRDGLIGRRAIQGELQRLGVTPVPRVATSQRILAAAGLTQPRGVASDAAYSPWPVAWEVNAIHAPDIITRHGRGGEEIDNFHTIDHYSHAVHLPQHGDKTSATACTHLVHGWTHLGLPLVQQFDNDGAFCGGHTHPHVLGQGVRWCLFCGIEVLFTPVHDPQRNYQSETFHSLWEAAFWSRPHFHNLAHVKAEVPLFLHWSHPRYRPPGLDGKTPAQMRRGHALRPLTAALRRLIPPGRLPLSAGRIHMMRQVTSAGTIALRNETWPVGPKWIGEYVRATIDTARQTLTLWHQAAPAAPWGLLKTRRFWLKETVHDLLPAFRRNRVRCREHWPG
jgi:hypothetical protein